MSRAQPCPAISDDMEEQKLLVRAARSVDTLLKACTNLVSIPAEGIIYCDACVPRVPSWDVNPKVAGVFRCPAELAEESPVMSSGFRNLKSTIGHHIASASHAKKVAQQNEKEEQSQISHKERDSTAYRVLLMAYITMKHSFGAQRFEEFVTVLHLCKVNVGDKNHSTQMLMKARDAFHDVMLKRIKAHVEGQPCVAVVADKTTLNHRTVDITAIITLDPKAPAGHMLQSLVIGAPVVTEHDGEGIAREIKATLATVGITASEQIAALAADGQYHHGRVPEKLAAAMSSDSTPHWDMPAIWDSSHLLNLAERDVLKSKESIWAQETIQSVTAITQHFTWGQGYEQLQDCTDQGKAAAPRLWSETRFAAHAGKVLKGFWRNIDAMVKSLEKRSCKARGAHAADLLRDLRVLKDEHFLRYVAALRDVYDVIGQGSVALQNTQLLPWEVTAAYDAAMEKLERMMNPLNVLAGTSPQREQTLVGRHVALCNLAELWPTFGQHGHRDVKQMREVATFCGNLLVSMKARRQGKDAHGNKRGTANAALLDNIRHVKTVGCLLDVAASSLPERIQVSQVRLACRELSAAKLVPPAAVPPEWSIIEGVKFLTSQKPSSNEALMQALWLTARENAALRPFLHLVIRCWLLCPAESVVESMGSVLKDVFGSKRQLNHDNAAKELLIRWNGPEVGRVDSLIRDVQRSRGFDFTRQGQRVKSIAGLVVTKQVNKGYTSDLFG